jgi:flagellar hook-associated protein 3 FlgL
MIDNLLNNINSGLTRMNRYNSQLSSNRKITRLSDDPVGVLNSMNARQKLNMYKQFQNNLISARNWVDQTESALMDMEDVVIKIKENVVTAANGTQKDSDKANIGILVGELKEHLLQMCNATVGDKYIFAGYNSTKAPFTLGSSGKVLYNGIDLAAEDTDPVLGGAIADTANASGFAWNGPVTLPGKYSILAVGDTLTVKEGSGAVVYSGTITTTAGSNTLDLTAQGLGTVSWTDSGAATADEVAAAIASAGTVSTSTGSEAAQDVSFVIGFNLKMDVSFTGVDIVGTGEENMFKILDELENALNSGASSDVISSYLEPLQGIQDRLLLRTVEVGTRSEKIETLENRYSQDVINYEEIRTDVEDIDQAQVILNYKLSQSIYEQALASGAKIILPTLMDFLR